jgi:hypothetical protein
VEFLDVSLDEAEKILAAARGVIEIRERSLQPAAEESESAEDAAPADEAEASTASAEPEAETTAEADSSEDPTAEGYDEAVQNGVPFSAEENIRAEFSADPVALTEADPMTEDELALQGAGRDLRPDVIEPAPDSDTEIDSALESSSDETAATDESLKDEKQ